MFYFFIIQLKTFFLYGKKNEFRWCWKFNIKIKQIIDKFNVNMTFLLHSNVEKQTYYQNDFFKILN